MTIPCFAASLIRRLSFLTFTPLESSAIDGGDVEIKCSFLIEGGVKAPSFLTGFAFLILLFLFFFSGEAGGDEFKLIPSLSLKEEYNDNIFFTEGDKKKDFITTVSPGLELINRTEKLDTSLLGRIHIRRYGSNEDLNDVDQNYRGKLRYSAHPKLKLSADAGFIRDSTVDRDLEVTGLVMRAVRRDRQNYSTGAEYIFSEKTKGNLSYSFERSDYKDPEFTDIKAHDASIGFTHDLSQYFSATMGRANLGYARYQFLDSTIDYYYSTIGMNRAFSEKWSILLDAGGSYTHSEFEVDRIKRDKKTNEGGGWIGQAALSYRGEKTPKGERTAGELTFNHRMMPAAGRAGAAVRTSLTFDIRHRFTYEFSGQLSAGYHKNKSGRGEFSTEAIDEATWRINPRLRYEFTKDIALEASYHFALVKDRPLDTVAKRNLFMINFIIQHPLFE